MFNQTIRDVNEEIRRLRKAGVLIGSSKEKPFGYYLPANEDEIKEYLSTFKHELFDMLDTFNKQKRARKAYLDFLHNNDFFKPQPDQSGQLVFH